MKAKRKFKIGDKVRCIKSVGYGPEVGRIYTVKGHTSKGSDPKAWFPVLAELVEAVPLANYWDAEHFEKVDE